MHTEHYVKHATEILGEHGPTGEFAEVTSGKIIDYGNNLIFCGTPDECIEMHQKLQIPTRLIPTQWRHVGTIVKSDYLWDSA